MTNKTIKILNAFFKLTLVVLLLVSSVIFMASYYNENKLYAVLSIAVIVLFVSYFVPKILRKKYGSTIEIAEKEVFRHKFGEFLTFREKDTNGLYPYKLYIFDLYLPLGFLRFKKIKNHNKSKNYYLDDRGRSLLIRVEFLISLFILVCFFLSQYFYNEKFYFVLLIVLIVLNAFLLIKIRNYIIKQFSS